MPIAIAHIELGLFRIFRIRPGLSEQPLWVIRTRDWRVKLPTLFNVFCRFFIIQISYALNTNISVKINNKRENPIFLYSFSIVFIERRHILAKILVYFFIFCTNKIIICNVATYVYLICPTFFGVSVKKAETNFRKEWILGRLIII